MVLTAILSTTKRLFLVSSEVKMFIAEEQKYVRSRRKEVDYLKI